MLSGEVVGGMLSLPSSSLLQPHAIGVRKDKGSEFQIALMEDQDLDLATVRPPYRFMCW